MTATRPWKITVPRPEAPTHDVRQAIEAAVRVPSVHNTQPWTFVVRSPHRSACRSEPAAAFHTRALEVPELRAFIRARFCNGLYPQLLRLGEPAGSRLAAAVRRSVNGVVIEEPQADLSSGVRGAGDPRGDM